MGDIYTISRDIGTSHTKQGNCDENSIKYFHYCYIYEQISQFGLK